MTGVRFVNANDLKSYLYRSNTKIDLLYQQIQEPNVKSTVSWKVDFKFGSRESKKQIKSQINDQDKLDAVVKALEEHNLVGSIEDSKAYIKGQYPMRWGIFNDEGFRPSSEGPLVYFSCVVNKTLLGLGGSSVHIGNPYGIGGTGSRSSTPALCRWLRCGLDTGERPPERYSGSLCDEMYDVSEAMALANDYLQAPTQNVEFLARVLWRGEGYALHSRNREERGTVILGTPLYVSQVAMMFVDA